MVLKRAETQLKVMLADTILALCRNALPFRGKVAVEGLLGVTLDDEEIFLVNINEIIRKECLETNQEIRKDITASSSSSPGKRETSGSEEGSSDEDSKGSPAKRRRKRKRRKSSGNSQKEDQTAVKREGEGEEEDVEDDDLVFVKSEPVEQSYGQDYSHDNSSLGANFSAQSEGVYHPGEGGSQSGDFSQIFTDGGQSAGLDHLQQLALQMSSGNVQPGLQGESQASTSQGDGALPVFLDKDFNYDDSVVDWGTQHSTTQIRAHVLSDHCYCNIEKNTKEEAINSLEDIEDHCCSNIPNNAEEVSVSFLGDIDVDDTLGGKNRVKIPPEAYSGSLTFAEEIARVKQRFTCEICDEILNTENERKMHIELHSHKDVFECQRCPQIFKSRLSLMKHEQIQHNVGHRCNFKCSKCWKSFTSLHSLRIHRKRHETGRPHRCKVCGNAYKRASNLKKHMLLHLEDKQYKCSICHRGFAQKSRLAFHMKVH